jgi:lipopolysaccharide export system permease protein
MLKILDRYILAEFFRKWFTLLALIVVIMLLKDLLTELGQLTTKSPSMISLVRLFVYRLPAPVVEMLPLSVILAMMFSVGALAKKKEILAIHACGVSYLRLALPLAIISVLIAVGTFICGETIVPTSMERAEYIRKVEIPQETRLANPQNAKADDSQKIISLTRNTKVTVKGKEGRFYNLGSFDSETKIMTEAIITDVVKLPDGRPTVRRRFDAAWAKLAEGKEEERLWHFYDISVREFDDNNTLIKWEQIPETDLVMEEGLDKILVTNKKGQDMSFKELQQFVKSHAGMGTNSYFTRLETTMHMRIAFPFAVFLLTMLGYTFAVRSSIRSMVIEFTLALASMLVWYVLYSSANKVARFDVLSPFLAAWYGNILFSAFTAWRFWNLEQVPKD